MLNVLVLGAGGFIGKHLVSKLGTKKNISVRVFGKTPLESFENIEFVQGDFEDKERLKIALSGQDIVYHLISHTVPATSWKNPMLEIERNLIPAINLIELAAEAKVRKICFASSGGTVYGYQQSPADEESPTTPFSPYGIVKKTIESFLQYAKLKENLNYDIYRISNIYGEGQNTEKGLGFINTALKRIIDNEPVVIFGNGKNVRDYIYVKDVVDLLMLSIEKETDNSDIYNVSSGHCVNLNELIDLIRKTVKIDFEVRYIDERQSDNTAVLLDNSKIMKYFGQKQFVSLEQGILKTFHYLKKAKENCE